MSDRVVEMLDALGKDPDDATPDECKAARKEALCRIAGVTSLNTWARDIVGLADRKGFRDDLANPVGDPFGDLT